MSKFCIGLMSGTSLDGIDGVIVKINEDGRFESLIESIYLPFSKSLRDELKELSESQVVNKEKLLRYDFLLGKLFADCVEKLLEKSKIDRKEIFCIGSHGLTVGHFPSQKKIFGVNTAFTLQIGDGDIIAEKTGILTVSDFRRKDMASGGEGAPLIPFVDKLLFYRKDKNVACLNIGGIANITIIPKNESRDLIAFDTGPGNYLSDLAVKRLFGNKHTCDLNGNFAKKGRVNNLLLERIFADEYFRKMPPKSTGKEYFGEDFLNFVLQVGRHLDFLDLFSTISYLTPYSIAKSIEMFVEYEDFPEILIVSGGGVNNEFFMESLKNLLPDVDIISSDKLGISSDFKEAIGFAILGFNTLNRIPSSIPSVTGCSKPQILGKISLP
ncbi:anhydro-N-acetylmuramic acid kinase [Thermotomaculum hydrothermale]|uniref:Anhydro-N-acetylmuramic acid kinase n=1 Tax=Thermotomaculum hydrothermale TaxID=981385 RepID=A0A7R6PNA4_9BACT|nr:anhydro-N-acetylmuramic acid kinase [Thermotomaculum hydrothermale]BBB32226.1 anhydro-N-acetylmuramic acid kinase [Thermotomaculum hydrothermale]